MSYVQDQDLINLSKPELAQKVISARQIWLKCQEAIKGLENKNDSLVNEIETLKAALTDREEEIKALLQKLHDVSEQVLETCCRAKHAYTLLQNFHNVVSEDNEQSEDEEFNR